MLQWILRLGLLILAEFSDGSVVAEDWNQFRGPQCNGHATSASLPAAWGSFLEAFAWKTKIPGQGWSSPIVVGNRIWLTAAEPVAMTETQQQAKLEASPNGFEYFQTHGAVTCYAMELDANTGNLIRKIELLHVADPPPIHAENGYASPTPASDGRRIFCHFGSLGTVAIDAQSGERLWSKILAVDDITGSGSSPILFQSKLILACDGGDQQYVIALNCDDGEVVWKTARPPIDANEARLRRAFSTPICVEYQGRTQLIAPAAQWLVSYDPETGNEWWRCRTADGYSVIPQPATDEGLVFTCTGYMKPELWAIRIDGSGDVSKTHVAWKTTRQAPEIASPIVVDHRLYFVSTLGVLSCAQTQDGRLLWQQRLSGSYAASPVYADGKMFFVNQAGLTTVLKPGSKYVELAKNPTFGQTLATPCITEDTLLIRTEPYLFCIGQP